MANAEQIRDWSSRGIQMRVHTRTHTNLQNLDSVGQISEILGAEEELSKMIEKSPETFAYPFGYYDARSIDIVKENFDLAFSVLPGLNHLGTDPHLLHRTMIDPRNALRQIGQMLKDGRNRPPSLFGRIRRKIWLAKIKPARSVI